MGLLVDEVEVELSSQTAIRYENLGYTILRRKNNSGKVTIPKGTKIVVKVEDLSDSSSIIIKCICDNENCLIKKELFIPWIRLRNREKDDNGKIKVYCNDCAHKLYAGEKARISLLKNSKTFYCWSVENSRKDLLKRWDKNKNKYEPNDVSFRTTLPIYLHCENNLHESQTYDFGCLYKNKNHKLGCKICSSLEGISPESLKFWSNKNNKIPRDYYSNSHEVVWWKCENDKHDDYERRIQSSKNMSFRCPSCVQERDESFLQEKIRLYLEEVCRKNNWKLNHEYNCELKCRNNKTNNRLPYDNEIIGDSIKAIIETHGEQHYKVSQYHTTEAKRKGITIQEQFEYRKQVDKHKKDFALKNGYKYLEIPYTADNAKNTWKTMIDKFLNIN